MSQIVRTLLFIAALCFLIFQAEILSAQVASPNGIVRVKDIVIYKNTGRNQLYGEGLVVGLNGTGDDKDKSAAKMAAGLAEKFRNIQGLADADFQGKNIARVMVSVDVDENTTVAGVPLEARVMAMGNTKSLQGGVLIQTELGFPGGAILAHAGGLLRTIANPNAGGAAGINVTTVTATLLEGLDIPFYESVMDENGNEARFITLALRNPDANTANEIARAINTNGEFSGMRGTFEEALAGQGVSRIAKAIGPGKIEIEIPLKWWGDEMGFRSIIDNTSVSPDIAASITVMVSTGAIAFTGNVRVLPGAIVVEGVTIQVGQDGQLPDAPLAGENVQNPAIEVGGDNSLPFQELLDTFNLLQLSASEKVSVIQLLEDNGMIQGKVLYKN